MGPLPKLIPMLFLARDSMPRAVAHRAVHTYLRMPQIWINREPIVSLAVGWDARVCDIKSARRAVQSLGGHLA